MTDDQIRDAILNAVRAAVEAYHFHSREISGGPEQDARWLADICAAAAARAIEGR